MKRNLEAALSHWDDFDRLHHQLTQWLNDVDNRLAADPDFKADLPEKRSSLEKYKVFVASMLGYFYMFLLYIFVMIFEETWLSDRLGAFIFFYVL